MLLLWRLRVERRRSEFRLYRGRRDAPRAGRSLIWGFVRIQELLRERVDLVGTSDFMGQQWQFDYVEIFVKVLHLQREE